MSLPLLLRHAGRRLVEQQHARAARERQRDLEQPLLAVGERARRLVELGLEAEAAEQVLDLGDDVRAAPRDAPEVRARALALGDGEAERFGGTEVGEELVDLEGAREAEPHAPMRRQRRDVAPVEQHAPCGRLESRRSED